MKRLIQFFRPFITSLIIYYCFSGININSFDYGNNIYNPKIFIHMKQFYFKFSFFSCQLVLGMRNGWTECRQLIKLLLFKFSDTRHAISVSRFRAPAIESSTVYRAAKKGSQTAKIAICKPVRRVARKPCKTLP